MIQAKRSSGVSSLFCCDGCNKAKPMSKKHFLERDGLLLALFVLSVAMVAYSNYLVFLDVPNEKIMGPVQRIFYFHVGSAMACYVAFAIVLVAGLAFLANRDPKMDVLGEAAGEVGFVFCTLVLGSGMIWGHSAWNTWFRWEPRLVTFLLLWLLFLGFNLLRRFGDPRKIGAHSAVLGIIGAISVPLMVFSIKLLPRTAQLHPQVVEGGGLKDPRMKFAFFFSMVALIVLQFFLVVLRHRIGLLELRFREGTKYGS
jgi:heme exporter protein C